ncbi:MAG TPA: thiamine pyrophosphate-dependent dehydrogenase E1 component subunit alpha [Anaerolineales bacterium]
MGVRQDLQVELSQETLLEMYWYMVLSRRLDERAWVLHRQGKVAFHISAIGHEAAQVGATFALRRGQDWLVPYYRDLAMLLALGLTPLEFMLGLMGKQGEPSSGARQMPSHWSLRRANVVSHSSPVATQSCHASGIGLGIKMRGDQAVVLTTIGEGATSQGEWYEAVNWAAVHRLPVIFMVENNSYAISVRKELQMAVAQVADKAAGLGLPGITVDGLDPLLVHAVMSEAVARARAGDGPTVVETTVHRMTPHSSDDDDRSYRPRQEVEAMKAQDPVAGFRDRLLMLGALNHQAEEQIQARAKQEVDQAVALAVQAPYPGPEQGGFPVYAEDIRHG